MKLEQPFYDYLLTYRTASLEAISFIVEMCNNDKKNTQLVNSEIKRALGVPENKTSLYVRPVCVN
jgi:hypothetical protein